MRLNISTAHPISGKHSEKDFSFLLLLLSFSILTFLNSNKMKDTISSDLLPTTHFQSYLCVAAAHTSFQCNSNT